MIATATRVIRRYFYLRRYHSPIEAWRIAWVMR